MLTAIFLPRLFEMTGLTSDSKFHSQESQIAAVALLNTLCFGPQPYAPLHPLTSLLCGLDLQSISDSRQEVPQEHIDVADDMLQGIIRHRDIGSTSIEGLRSTFLARPGVLVLKESGWKRMETYTGVVILATNLRTNLDDALMRRIQSYVHFPMPSVSQLAALWRQMLGSLADDSLDITAIAEEFELSGGVIAGVVQYAVLASLNEGRSEITQQDLRRGVARELKKEATFIS